MIMNGELHTITKSLSSVHLGYAVDSYHRSRSIREIKDHPLAHQMQANVCALSSIMHAYCALESSINFFGYELFSNKHSTKFIAPEKRDLLVAKLARTWDVTSALEKYLYLVTVHKGGTVPAPLQNRLRELNMFRNWITHGVSYTTTYLMQPTGDSSSNEYLVIDTEHSVDWHSKFPNTRFKIPEDTDNEDAELALRVVFEALLLLIDRMEQPLWFITYEQDKGYHILHKETFDIEKIFANIMAP